MNKITIYGNVGKDAETRNFENSSSVSEFTIATNKTWKTKDGEKKQQTTWFTVKLWNKAILATFIKKGTPLLIEGEMQCDVWEDKEGNKRYSWHINAREIHFTQGSQKQESNDAAPKSDSEQEYEDQYKDLPF